MAQAKHGDTVKVHYTGKFPDGTIFDSSVGGDPLEFKIGEGEVIPGFEEAVVGMNPGESKIEQIPAERGYGPYREEMLIVVPRAEIPDTIKPEVGEFLHMRHPEGYEFPVLISKVDETSITLDANHPLAGKELVFDIEVVEVVAQSRIIMP